MEEKDDPLKLEEAPQQEQPREAEAQQQEEVQVDQLPPQQEVPKEVEKVMVEELKDWSMELLTVAVPVASRNGKCVLEAISWIYSRFRALHVPIHRIHSDRAREFTSKEVKKWVDSRDLSHTFTEGDSGEANGRAERELGILKALTRAQLVATGEPKELWPLALRQAAELRHRQQLRRLGIETPPLIPFATVGYAKRKRWERGEKGEASLLTPMRKVKILGPAATMSLTSKGYYCRIEDTGQYIFSTAVLVPKPRSRKAFDQVHAEVADRPHDDFELVRRRVEAQQDRGLQELDEIEQEGLENGCQEEPASEENQLARPSSLQSRQAQQQLDQIQVIDDDCSPSEWGEPPEDLMIEGFVADLEDEYDRLFPEDGSSPRPQRRRLRGKQTVPARLQVLNLAGGECRGEEQGEHRFQCGGCGLLQGLQERRQDGGKLEEGGLGIRKCKFCEEDNEEAKEEEEGDQEEREGQSEEWGELKTQQHWALSKLISAEMATIDGSHRDQMVWMKNLTVLQEEREKLEQELLQERPQEEVLQGRTVSNIEVRNNFEDWREAIDKELKTLTGNGAIVPITKERRDEMIREHGTKMECIPSKIVAVIKAGGRHKARLIVACGNYAVTEHITQEEKTASGADIVALRILIRLAAQYGWDCSSLDIKGAFLLAPRRKRNLTVLCPPKILKEKGMIPEDLMWQVNKAVYGLVESPADWGSYRDEELQGVVWEVAGVRYKLRMTQEANVWKILCDGDPSEVPQGYLATYVDDMLMVGPNPILHGLMDAIGSMWECSSKEFAEEGRDLRFCGMEIRKTKVGFDLHQSSYILDLLKRRNVEKKADVPMGKVEDLDEEEPKRIDPNKLREAQQLSGELIWVATRTRMDVAYAVGAMSRRLHKDPEGALRVGQQILEYLNQHPTLGVCYEPCDVVDLEQSQVPRDINTVEIFADVSFAPGSEAYRSVQGIITALGGQPVQWHTGRQPLIATSTAEGELLSYQEAQIMGSGIEELLFAMGLQPLIIMYGDNRAAISLATLEAGSWRTRRLRIRAHKLRQTLKVGTTPERVAWQLRHMAGTELVADGLTKALGKQAFVEFIKKSKMKERKEGSMKYLNVERDGGSEKDLISSDLDDQIFYKQMTALAAAGLVLMMIGEHHLAAVLLLMLKCSLLAQGEGSSSRREKRLKRSEEPKKEEIEVAVRALRVERPPLRELEDLSDNVNLLITHRPTGHDKWLPIQPGRWVIRTHGRHRKRCFHPLHQRCPVDSTQLEPTRFTVIWYGDGLRNRTILRDEWDATPAPIDYGEWKGYTIFKIREDQEPGGVGATQGYGGRDPSTTTARRRGQDALHRHQPPRSRPEGLQRVTAELQDLGQGGPHGPEVLQGPLPPRPARVQDVAPDPRPSRARSSNDFPAAAQPGQDLQVRGAAVHPELRDRVRPALYIDPDDFVDSLMLSREDFVPQDFDDDGFSLVTSQESSSPSPPRLRAFRVNGTSEPVEATGEEGSMTSSTSRWSSSSTPRGSSSSTSSSGMDLSAGEELSIDPPEGQRGIWNEFQVLPKQTAVQVIPKAKGSPAMPSLQARVNASRGQAVLSGMRAAPAGATVRDVFTVFSKGISVIENGVLVHPMVVHPKPKSCAICKSGIPGSPANLPQRYGP